MSGAEFSVVTARPIGLATVRVTFTHNPRAVSADNADDALNPANYTVTGPDANDVSGALSVIGDLTAIDLFLEAPLHLGNWTLTVANVVQDNGQTLSSPTTIPFVATANLEEEALSGGAINDDVANVLRKFLNPAIKGPNVDAVLDGLAAGDRISWNNAKLAFDQIFLASASSTYLDQRGIDVGVRRTSDVAMGDALFRQLAIVSKTRKLTQEALLEILEIYYGADAARASSTCTVVGPYALVDGDELVLLLDEEDTITVTFESRHFTRIGEATPLEVSAAISRALKAAHSDGYSLVVQKPDDAGFLVRVYSGSLGLSSSVRVIGGRAQTQLLFPSPIFPESGSNPFATWSVSLSPDTLGNIRIAMTAGTVYDLAQVETGDRVYIYGSEFAACSCIGTFEITDVHVSYSGATKIQWFEIYNPLGTAQGSVVQTAFDNLVFCEAYRRTVYDAPRHVTVAQVDDKVDVVIHATSQAVNRSPGLAIYMNTPDPLTVSALARDINGIVTATSTAHGLAPGDWVTIEGAVGIAGANGDFAVATVPTANTFTYALGGLARTAIVKTATGTITAIKTAAGSALSGVPGPFTYDPREGLPVRSIEGVSAQDFAEGRRYQFLQLDDGTDPNPALAFPDEVGYIALSFGHENQVGPIKYLGRISDVALAIDAGFTFPYDVPAGVSVILLHGRTPFSPPRGALSGSAYATGSAAGRIEAVQKLGESVAGGVGVNIEIIYPSDHGLGGAGFPQDTATKLSDKVTVWGGDHLDAEVADLKLGPPFA